MGFSVHCVQKRCQIMKIGLEDGTGVSSCYRRMRCSNARPLPDPSTRVSPDCHWVEWFRTQISINKFHATGIARGKHSVTAPAGRRMRLTSDRYGRVRIVLCPVKNYLLSIPVIIPSSWYHPLIRRIAANYEILKMSHDAIELSETLLYDKKVTRRVVALRNCDLKKPNRSSGLNPAIEVPLEHIGWW